MCAMKKYLVAAALTFVTLSATSQIYTSFYHFDHVNQSLMVNPSNPHNHRLVIGIPGASGISTQIYNSFAKAGDYFNDNSLNDRIETIIGNMDERARLNVYNSIDILYAGWGTKHGYISMGVQLENNFNYMFPRDLFSFLYYGNATFGNDLSFDATNFNVENSVLLNYHLGYQRYALDSALIIGGRFKYINGLIHSHFSQFDASLQTDMFDWKISTDITLESSGYQDFDSVDFQASDYLGGNRGFGIDLGATYMYKNMEFSLAILNIGQVKWSENINNYRSQGTFTYSGAYITESNQTIDFDRTLDSLESQLEFKELNSYSYTSKLPLHILGGFEYKLTKKHAFAATYQGTVWQGQLYSNLGINYIGRYARRFNMLLGYNHLSGNQSAFALGLSGALGPLQLYFMSDFMTGVFDIKNLNSAGFRFGLNLAFLDKVEKPKKEKKNKEKKSKKSSTEFKTNFNI